MPDELPDESLDELEPPFDEVFLLVPESSPLLRRELPSESPFEARCRRSDDFWSDLSDLSDLCSPGLCPPDRSSDDRPDDLCSDLSSPESRSPDPSSDDRCPDDLCPDRPDDDFPSDRDSSDRDSWAFTRWDFDCGLDFVRCVSWPEAADRSPSRDPEPDRPAPSDRSERCSRLESAASRRAEAISRTAPCPPITSTTARARRTFEADEGS